MVCCMISSSFCFSLNSNIYAARFEDSVIILDIIKDQYLSLIDNSAKYFLLILSNQFDLENGKYCMIYNNDNIEEYNYWITYFLEKEFIIKSKISSKILSPLKEGGLINYRWNYKKSWQSWKHTSFLDIIRAFLMLVKIHKSIKRDGMKGILNLIKKYSLNKKLFHPTQSSIQSLSSSLDIATMIYPKKTVCLQWAAAFVLLALQKGWDIQLHIGVQTNPFYAHAWAQTASGFVVNDDPQVALALSVILKQPYKGI